jgi:hypothetical protein
VVSFADPPRGCARAIDTGWLKYPCSHTLPCPLHSRKPHPEPQSDNLGPGEHWFHEAHPPLPSQGVEAPQTSAPCPLPAPRLFEENVA